MAHVRFHPGQLPYAGIYVAFLAHFCQRIVANMWRPEGRRVYGPYKIKDSLKNNTADSSGKFCPCSGPWMEEHSLPEPR